MSNFNGFTADHIGEVVTDISTGSVGTIIRLKPLSPFPVVVEFETIHRSFTFIGYAFTDDLARSLYFGDKIKVEVTGEVIPEKKLICPVCGVSHPIVPLRSDKELSCFFVRDYPNCPFHCMKFIYIYEGQRAMKNLIKAMETKKKWNY